MTPLTASAAAGFFFAYDDVQVNDAAQSFLCLTGSTPRAEFEGMMTPLIASAAAGFFFAYDDVQVNDAAQSCKEHLSQLCK